MLLVREASPRERDKLAAWTRQLIAIRDRKGRRPHEAEAILSFLKLLAGDMGSGRALGLFCGQRYFRTATS